MDAHAPKQRIVVLIALTAALAAPASAALDLIYTASFDLRIPADPNTGHAWMQDAVIHVPESFTVIDLDVEITLTHTSVFDLQLFLKGPDGTRVALNYYNPSDEFFEGEDYTATIFDDEAETPIELAQAPFSGRFKPRHPTELSDFDNQNPQGPWTLQIYDAWHNNTGTLQELRLIFKIPEPSAFLIFLFATPILHTSARRR